MTATENGRSYDAEFAAELHSMEAEAREALLANEWRLNEFMERQEHRKAVMTVFEQTIAELQKIGVGGAKVIDKILRLPKDE